MRTDSKHDPVNVGGIADVRIFDTTYDPFVVDMQKLTCKTEALRAKEKTIKAKALLRAKVLAREFEAKGMELGHSLATLEDMHEIAGPSVEGFAETTLGLKLSVATYWLGKYRTIEQSGVGQKRLSKVCAANLSILADLVPDECFPACIEEAEWMPPDAFLDLALRCRETERHEVRARACTRALAAAAANSRVGTAAVTPVANQNAPSPSWRTGKTRPG